MSAEPTVATNVKSIYMGGGQPGTYKVVDSEGNTILDVDLDNERIDIGHSSGVGFFLRLLKGLIVWEIKFLRNLNVRIEEHWGPLVTIPEGSGDYAFRVRNASGYQTFQARNDGAVKISPVASAPSGNLENGLVYYDASANKLKLRTPSGWETITSAV